MLWSKKNDGGYVPSPVAVGGKAFVVTDEGLGSCWDVKTGKMHWKERLGGHHSGSGVVAGGRVYFTDDEGVTHVLAADPEFDVIAANAIGERCYSSPRSRTGRSSSAANHICIVSVLKLRRSSPVSPSHGSRESIVFPPPTGVAP